MNGADRQGHDRALRLAAALLDFGLAEGELEELNAHLDTCPACRREAGRIPRDAALLDFAVFPALPSRRVDDAVFGEIARRRRPASGMLVLVAASLLVVAALMGAVGAGAALLGLWPRIADSSPVPQPTPVVDPSPPPSTSPAPGDDVATPRPDAGWTAVPGSLPTSSGDVQMAPGPYGGLYVVVDSEDETVVALLDAASAPRPGWPTALPGWSCDAPSADTAWLPGVAPDGSVRIVCYDNGTAGEGTTAFSFDAEGQPQVGWPVALPDNLAGPPRTVDGTLFVAAREGPGDAGALRLVAIGADGSVRTGARVEVPDAAGLVSIGPDGTAYLVAGNEITAFDLDGARDGWPVRVEGDLSALAFGPNGRIYLTAGEAGATTLRLLAVEADGRVVDAGPGDLPITGSSAWTGAGPAGGPIAPLVADDGTAYVVGEADGETVVYAIDAAGAVVDGWPYRDPATLPWQGTCPPEALGCGVARALPAVGSGGTLYLPVGAVGPATGGSLVALGRDGRVIHLWPVGLKRSGADFWSVVGAPGETAFALAVEPEQGGTTSATVLDIAIDHSVRYKETVVAPGGI